MTHANKSMLSITLQKLQPLKEHIGPTIAFQQKSIHYFGQKCCGDVARLTVNYFPCGSQE